MNQSELKKAWLRSEARQQQFSGWDFSAIEQQYHQEVNTWDYLELVKSYLNPTMRLLDMGTGGGELLATLQHPLLKTAVTEGWPPNYQLLLKKLAPKGVNVQFVGDEDSLNFPDNSFDIVLNSHASFSIEEVKRVLKPTGIFITQQVGDLNGVMLASKLIPTLKKERFDWHLSAVTTELKKRNFTILYENECYPEQQFFDMDAFIYYSRTISWEFPNFSVETHFAELLSLYEELLRVGFLRNLQHRFVVVARVMK